jgi:hypothetical protein
LDVACPNAVLEQKIEHVVERAKHFQIFSVSLRALKWLMEQGLQQRVEQWAQHIQKQHLSRR